MTFAAFKRLAVQILDMRVNLLQGVQEQLYYVRRNASTAMAFMYNASLASNAMFVQLFGPNPTVQECLIGDGWNSLNKNERDILLRTVAGLLIPLVLTVPSVDEVVAIMADLEAFQTANAESLSHNPPSNDSVLLEYLLKYLQTVQSAA